MDEIRHGLRLGTLQSKFVPVLTGSALKNKGIQPMLDAVTEYLPSPLDVPPTIGLRPGTDQELLRTVDDKEPFSALAFKIAADPFVGKLAFFRVYSGTLKAGSYVLNTAKGKKERVGRDPPDARQPPRGDRRGLRGRHRARSSGLKDTFTGDTLSRSGAPDPARDHLVPRAGHRGQDRAEDEGRPGQDGHRPPAPGGGGPDLPGQDGSGERRDAHRRHGRAAPGRHRRPHGPRVQGRGERRPAAGLLPRDHPPQGRGQRPLRPPDRRQGPVRPRRPDARAEREGRRVRVRRQDRRRHDPARVHARRRTRHPRDHRDRRLRRLPDGRRAGHRPRRVVPRGGLVGDGVQDRRLDGRQGRGREGGSRRSSSR